MFRRDRGEKKEEKVPPHPRQEPRISGPLTVENLERVFTDCVDFAKRQVALGGDPARRATLCYLSGMVKMERISDYILRPLAQDEMLGKCGEAEAVTRIQAGALYNLIVEERTTADQGVFDLINGWCLLFFPQTQKVLSFLVQTEEKRSISPSENEPPLKGPRDSFVESVRTNTSILRRRVRAPGLRIKELLVGRQTVTPVDLAWIEGIANPETVAAVEGRLADMDIDGLISPASLEEYLTGDVRTAFPTILSTERPDRFSAGILEGRVGVLVDGQPMGWLLPAGLSQFFRTPQDKALSWMAASALLVIRYLCMLTTLFLPALYIAAVTFHLELLPTRLALAIVAAKQDVPFTTIFEVLMMLVAFEVIQEAGLRLPSSIGQTVSILGGPYRLSRRPHRRGHRRGGGVHHALPGLCRRPAALAFCLRCLGRSGRHVWRGHGGTSADLPPFLSGVLRGGLSITIRRKRWEPEGCLRRPPPSPSLCQAPGGRASHPKPPQSRRRSVFLERRLS